MSTFEDAMIEYARVQDDKLEDLGMRLDAATREISRLQAELEAAQARIGSFYVGA